MTTQIIFDHRGRTPAGKEGPLEVRIGHDRKYYYINTGIKIRGCELCGGYITGRSDSDILNERLGIITRKIEQAVNRRISENIPVDVAEIRREVYAGTSTEGDAMLNWIVEQVPLLPVRESTRKRYHILVSRLREYRGLLGWEDLTVENIYAFDAWLHKIDKPQSNGDIQAGTDASKIGDAGVYNYHKTLRALLNRAVKFGIIDINPYDKMRGEFSRGDTDNTEYLDEEEIAAIESLRPIAGTQMAMARDLFIFQVYTGLSYADTQAFDISEYKKVGGKWVNSGNRIKTGVPYVSQLLPQAVEVLERYGMQTPKVNNVQYNASLKVIQQALGIRTRLHSHLGRHTFATRMLSLGVKLENVSRMLGHKNITQTQRYAKVLAESVRDDFSMVEEKLKNRQP
jgi:integrase